MKLILAFDNDTAGELATIRAIKTILDFSVLQEKWLDMRLRLGAPISFSLNEDVEIDRLHQQMPKPEREKIFLENGVTIGEAFEARRAYLENRLKKTARRYFEIQEHNQKYPEFP